MQLPKKIQKYLSKQNLQKWQVEFNKDKLFNNIIVIPAINELDNIPKLFNSLLHNSKKHLSETLMLVVVNNTEEEKEDIIEGNQKLISYLREIQKDEKFNLNVGFIDASSNGKEFPPKEGGVGLARKIGMDLALNYFDFKNENKKIIFSLDADCTVTDNYLEEIIDSFNNKKYHAAIVNFEHSLPENEFEKAAIINYEIFIRYYVLGLKYAQSPYAYYSVGSTIICDAESYVKVGGMNKRKAGEDFYFLEKLAKLNKINKIDKATVHPSPRSSTRVPFGTGQRVQRFIDNTQNEYLVYSPQSFEILKQWLKIFDNDVLSKNWITDSLEQASNIDQNLYNFLVEQKFETDWINILNNSKSQTQIKLQKKFWMDGFRTLKLIHFLRDAGYQMDNTFYAINLLFQKMKIDIEFRSEDEIPNLDTQLKYLQKLRELT